MKRLALCVSMVAWIGGCGPGIKGGPSMNNKVGGGEVTTTTSSVISQDILAREPVANSVSVHHILISWKDLAENFGGQQNPPAQQRSKQDAEAEVNSLLTQLKGGGDFDTLAKAHSDDTTSAASNHTFVVTPGAQLVIEFRNLSLRLKVGEIGVCQSDFGFHIIKRLE